jgi:fucose 4-O-acetylase-like acetyltransferase
MEKKLSMKEYYDYLDLAKGIGILLVIMGHSLFPLHIAIDIFHMPLFFLISGITFRFAKNQDVALFLQSKVDRILIPLLFFSLASGVFELILPVTFSGPFNGSLWFLQVIFTSILVYFLINYLTSKTIIINSIILFFSIISYLFAYYNIKLFFELDLVLMSTVFFHVGYIIKEYYKSASKIRLIVLFFVFSCLFGFGLLLTIAKGADGVFLFRLYKYSYPLFFITSLSGIFVVLTLAKIFQRVLIFNCLGRNSLVILCVHFPFIQYCNVFVSKLDMYNSGLYGKLFIGIGVYVVTLLFSVVCIEFCKKFLPKFSGYNSVFINKSL